MKKEITRCQYLKSLDVVLAYHEQIKKLCSKVNVDIWNSLKVGDRVSFDSYNICCKNLTIGKEYPIIQIIHYTDKNNETRIENIVINKDNGKKKKVYKHYIDGYDGYKIRFIQKQK